MFRITRGMHVQHIQFPFPVLRDLDADAAEPSADAEAPVAQATPVETDGPADDTTG